MQKHFGSKAVPGLLIIIIVARWKKDVSQDAVTISENEEQQHGVLLNGNIYASVSEESVLLHGNASDTTTNLLLAFMELAA